MMNLGMYLNIKRVQKENGLGEAIDVDGGFIVSNVNLNTRNSGDLQVRNIRNNWNVVEQYWEDKSRVTTKHVE